MYGILGGALLSAGCSSENNDSGTKLSKVEESFPDDFDIRYNLPESTLPDWRTAATTSPFGPDPASLPAVSAPSGSDPATWMQQRLLQSLNYWIDQGLNYCHHHIPLWTPPGDTGAPFYQISNGNYKGAMGETQTCTPARRTNGSQKINDIPTNCSPDTANCIDPSVIQWKGVDCSDFTSWIYNFAFGVAADEAPLPTGIGTQACRAKVTEGGITASGGGVLLDINYSNFDDTKAYLQPGDLLYIMPEPKKDKPLETTIVHVVVWTGKVWGDIKDDTAYYKEGDGVNFGAVGDRVGGDFTDYSSDTDRLTPQTPLIVDSHFAGPAYRPFMGWYREHLSHVRRIINSAAAESDPTLSALLFPPLVYQGNGIYKTVSPQNSGSILYFSPALGATKNCYRVPGFNPA